MVTATVGAMRAWSPTYSASRPTEAYPLSRLMVDELLSRHPASVMIEEIVGNMGADRLAEAIDELTRAAVKIGRILPAIGDLGEPGIEIGFEAYIRELAKRANVAQVAGRVESDGLFHVADDGGES